MSDSWYSVLFCRSLISMLVQSNLNVWLSKETSKNYLIRRVVLYRVSYKPVHISNIHEDLSNWHTVVYVLHQIYKSVWDIAAKKKYSCKFVWTISCFKNFWPYVKSYGAYHALTWQLVEKLCFSNVTGVLWLFVLSFFILKIIIIRLQM